MVFKIKRTKRAEVKMSQDKKPDEFPLLIPVVEVSKAELMKDYPQKPREFKYTGSCLRGYPCFEGPDLSETDDIGMTVREVVEPDLQFINHKSQHSDDAARDAELKEYMNINDFESALRTRSDKGSIYTNAIIIGWLEDTFKVAWNAAMKHVRGGK